MVFTGTLLRIRIQSFRIRIPPIRMTCQCCNLLTFKLLVSKQGCWSALFRAAVYGSSSDWSQNSRALEAQNGGFEVIIPGGLGCRSGFILINFFCIYRRDEGGSWNGPVGGLHSGRHGSPWRHRWNQRRNHWLSRRVDFCLPLTIEYMLLYSHILSLFTVCVAAWSRQRCFEKLS